MLGIAITVDSYLEANCDLQYYPSHYPSLSNINGTVREEFQNKITEKYQVPQTNPLDALRHVICVLHKGRCSV